MSNDMEKVEGIVRCQKCGMDLMYQLGTRLSKNIYCCKRCRLTEGAFHDLENCVLAKQWG